jgi:hypothetical protein
MSRYFLSQDAYFCIAEAHAIFLNLERDRYTAVIPEGVPELEKLVCGWPRSGYRTNYDRPEPESNGLEDIQTLLDEGLLTEDEDRGKDPKPIAVEPIATTIDSVRGHFPVIEFRDLLNFVFAWVTTTLLLRCFPLKYAVHRARKRKERKRPVSQAFDIQKAYRLMTAYFILRPNFFSHENACLRDSLTFIEFFARYDLYPTWVFGVTARPFSAHSWVQEGPMVLNDYIPHVKRFTPILAV